MTAYYNEIDPDAVAALRQLIAEGVVASGEVDERSIKDVKPDDLKGFTQCHFFAGGGLWSVAARLAGWPDERPIWTGSCPCQPFSSAGARLGTDDARHLWPDFHRLISAARPPIIMGEQVAGAAGRNWFHGVRSDLARSSYAGRAVDFPACAVDAPHERNRLWWIAVYQHEVECPRCKGHGCELPSFGANYFVTCQQCGGRKRVLADSEGCGGGARLRKTGPLGHGAVIADRDGGDGVLANAQSEPGRRDIKVGRSQGRAADGRTDAAGDMAHADIAQLQGQPSTGKFPVIKQDARTSSGNRSGRNGSWWADAEWITCHDGKARRAKPEIPMLVDGMVGRNGLWRLAGNSISPIAAAEVIAAFLDVENEAES